MRTIRIGVRRLATLAMAVLGLGAVMTLISVAAPAGAATYGPQTTVPALNLGFPVSLATTPQGDLYILDNGSGPGTGRLIDFEGGNENVVEQGLDSPTAVAADDRGNVWVIENNQVVEFPSSGPSTVVPFSGVLSLDAIAVDGEDDVFVSDYDNQKIVEMSASGVQKTLPIVLPEPASAVAVDTLGDVYVAEFDGTVTELTEAGSQTTVPLTLPEPFALSVDDADDLYALTRGTGPNAHDEVVELPRGGSQVTLPFTDLSETSGLAADDFGNVYVSGVDPSVVHELPAVTPTGTLTTSTSSAAPGATIGVSSVTPCPLGTTSVNLLLFRTDGHPIAGANPSYRDTSGNWAGSLTVPIASAPGPYFVGAQCENGTLLQNYATVNLTVTPPVPVATSTSLVASSVGTTFGQPVTFTATVTPAALSAALTGTVSFSDGSAGLGTIPLGSTRQAALTTSGLSVGAHTITATYSGDASYASGSTTLSVTVTRAATKLVAGPGSKATSSFSATLTRSDNGAPVAGQLVVFTLRPLLGGTDTICSATTGATGVASCHGAVPFLDQLFDSTYTATFWGSTSYEASTASGSYT